LKNSLLKDKNGNQINILPQIQVSQTKEENTKNARDILSKGAVKQEVLENDYKKQQKDALDLASAHETLQHVIWLK
jgi:hypothetical protein